MEKGDRLHRQLSLLFNHRGSPGDEGRLAVGRTAPHSGRTLIPSRTLPRIVSPNTGWAGGKGSVGREGPLRRRRQCGRWHPSAGAYAARRLYW
jgi:hypothetical protein